MNVWRLPTPEQLWEMHSIQGNHYKQKCFLASIPSEADRRWMKTFIPLIRRIINHGTIVFITIVQKYGYNHKLVHYAYKEIMKHLVDALNQRPTTFKWEFWAVLDWGEQSMIGDALRKAAFKELVDQTLDTEQSEKAKVNILIEIMSNNLIHLFQGIRLIESKRAHDDFSEIGRSMLIERLCSKVMNSDTDTAFITIIGLIADLCDLIPHIPHKVRSQYIDHFYNNEAPMRFVEFDGNNLWSEYAKDIINRYVGASKEGEFLACLEAWLPPVIQQQNYSFGETVLKLLSQEDFTFSHMSMGAFHRLIDLCSVVALVPDHPIEPSSILFKHFLLDMIFKPVRNEILSDEQKIKFYSRLVTNDEFLELSTLPFKHAFAYKRVDDLCNFLKNARLLDNDRIVFAKDLLRILNHVISLDMCDQDGLSISEDDRWKMAMKIVVDGIGLAAFENAANELIQETQEQPERVFLERLKTLVRQHVQQLRAKKLGSP